MATSIVGHKVHERGELGRIQRHVSRAYDEWLERRGFKKPSKKFRFVRGVKD